MTSKDIIEKIKAIPKPQAKKFMLMQVTINVSQISPSHFIAIAKESNSPLCFEGNSEELATMFGRWLENTFNSMARNGVKSITIKATR